MSNYFLRAIRVYVPVISRYINILIRRIKEIAILRGKRGGEKEI